MADADVEINGPPMLDRAHAEVSYHLGVVTGPLYYLHKSHDSTTSMLKQRGEARELLGMKSGDIFDQMAINSLNHKISVDPALKAYGFTFAPAKDKATAKVDLTLDFYKVSDKSNVSVK